MLAPGPLLWSSWDGRSQATCRRHPVWGALRKPTRGSSVTALTLRIHLRFGVVPVLGVLVAVIFGSAVFSMFSLVACIVKTRERFMGIGQVLTMPLFFASNAIYPMAMIPDWLKVVRGG